jgi:hypothetical protein
MFGDRTWRIPWRSLDLGRLLAAAQNVASGFAGVTVEVEDEGEGTHTCFFSIPVPEEDIEDDIGPFATCELSVYDLDGGTILLTLEADAGHNSWLDEDADQVAEALAEVLGARSVELG